MARRNRDKLNEQLLFGAFSFSISLLLLLFVFMVFSVILTIHFLYTFLWKKGVSFFSFQEVGSCLNG